MKPWPMIDYFLYVASIHVHLKCKKNNKFMHFFSIKYWYHINPRVSPITNSTKTRLINDMFSQMLPNPIILENGSYELLWFLTPNYFQVLGCKYKRP